jgi:GNAT superfamily N-acetyltransferase
MITLDWMSNHIQHSNTYAAWLHRQFAYEFSDQTQEEWQAEFAEGQKDGAWRCLIAMHQDDLVGGVSLATKDLAMRPDLGPWLACLFVHPDWRGQAVAQRLIAETCNYARTAGVQQLFLHTHDKALYYRKLGWQIEGSFQAWSRQHYLMTLTL